MTTPVYLEVGAKKVFACAVDWPGWCRSGKDEGAALEALAAYAPRYAVVAEEAGVRFPKRHTFEVVGRRKGSGTTDFGAPGAVGDDDHEPLTKPKAERLATLVEAAWQVLDRVAAGAPATLRKGPRGGGRDRDEIVAHVRDTEEPYGRKMGVKGASRDDLLRVIRAAEPVTGTAWPVRYAARRLAWHALDHAWEIEDKS